MDFSPCSWQLYCKHTPHAPSQANSVEQRVKYLTQHQEFKRYFAILEHEAANIGRMIKKHVTTKIPNLLIGVYAQTMPSSWFYRGIMRGLGSKDAPMILATFNTDYYSHYQWLLHNKIYAIHGVPFLLSKFQQPQDFNLIAQLRKYHNFSWYLRPSRMLYEKKDGFWWSSETSPLDSKTLAQQIKLFAKGVHDAQN
jgi:hypothetical protein